MAEYSSSTSLSFPLREMYKSLPEYKVCILGNSNVGKSMILRYLHGGGKAVTNENLSSTIGMDLLKREVQGTSYHLRLQIWDTGGHERFRAITGNYLRNSHVVLLIYDITNMKSYESIPAWLELAQANVSGETLFMLVGNKLDLFEERVVGQFNANAFAMEHKMEYFECSASKGMNVLFLFNQIAKDISYTFKEVEQSLHGDVQESRSSIFLSDSDFEVPATRKCLGYY